MTAAQAHASPPTILWTDTKGKEHKYHPDFFVPDRNLVVEIKSTWTMNRRRRGLAVRKMHASLVAGYDFLIVIYLDSAGTTRKEFLYKHKDSVGLKQLMKEVRLP